MADIKTTNPLDTNAHPEYYVDSKLKESEKFVDEKKKEKAIKDEQERERRRKVSEKANAFNAGAGRSSYGNVGSAMQEQTKKNGEYFGTEKIPVEIDKNGNPIKTSADKARELAESAEGITEEEAGRLHNSLPDIFANAEKLAESLPDGDLKMWLKSAGLGGYQRAKLLMQAEIDYSDMAKDLRESLARNTLSAYMNGDGQFTQAGIDLMRKESEGVARKAPVSTGRLDSLKEQGPTQQALPQIPDEDAKILAKMISGGFATIMKGIAIAKAPTDRSAMIGALMEDPGIRIMSGVAPMLASDIAAYEERKRQVEDKNIELYERYNHRIDEAMAQFDAEANASEREYNQMVVNGIYKNMARIDKLYSLTIDLKGKEKEMLIASQAIQNQEELFNKGAANDYGLKKMSMAHEIHIESLRAGRARQNAGLFDNSQFIQQMLPESAIYSAPVQVSLKSLNTGTAILEQYPDIANPMTPSGSINKLAIMNANQVADTIDDMASKGDITPKQAQTMDTLVVTNSQESRRLRKLDRGIMKEWVKKNIDANGEFVVAITSINDPSFRALNNELFEDPNMVERKKPDGTVYMDVNGGDWANAQMTGYHFVERRMKDAYRQKQRMGSKNSGVAASKEAGFSNELGTVPDTGHWYTFGQ